MATLKAIQNHIIFQFEEKKTTHMGISQFKEETDWGFEYANTDDSLEIGRWVNVVCVGKDVPDDVKPGMRVCVDKLKWTNDFPFEGQLYWRTDYDNIILIDDSVKV